MERLTKRSKTGLPVLVRGRALGPAFFPEARDYTDYFDALERLAQYEDTGLSPEEYKMRKEDLRVLDLFKEQSSDSEEAIKIAEARREKRLFILPVGVGKEIYSIRYGEVETGTVWQVEINSYTSPAVWIRFTVQSKLFGPMDGHTRIDLAARDGIYFTREEAEAALKGETNETTDL